MPVSVRSKGVKQLIRRALAGPVHLYGRHSPIDLGKELLLERVVMPEMEEHPQDRLVTTRAGFRMRLRTADFIQRYVYAFGAWEPNLTRWIERTLRPGDVFVDVGANVGYFTLLASRLVGPAGRVVAIEASMGNHRILQDQIALNDARNVRTVQAAASHERSRLRLFRDPGGNLGLTSTADHGGLEPEAEVDCYPLADLLQPDEIDRVRVIKIDVEGGELDVVRGLAPLLGRLPREAQIICEVAPERIVARGQRIGELMGIFRDAGFLPSDLANDYTVGGVLRALRRPEGPRPVHGDPQHQADIIFARAP
jgi:FkbM family methyltransferase